MRMHHVPGKMTNAVVHNLRAFQRYYNTLKRSITYEKPAGIAYKVKEEDTQEFQTLQSVNDETLVRALAKCYILVSRCYCLFPCGRGVRQPTQWREAAPLCAARPSIAPSSHS